MSWEIPGGAGGKGSGGMARFTGLLIKKPNMRAFAINATITTITNHVFIILSLM
jgi:hypothetical protein